jgi:hypothetical protein
MSMAQIWLRSDISAVLIFIIKDCISFCFYLNKYHAPALLKKGRRTWRGG